MLLKSLDELKQGLAPNVRLLALDLGEKTIGLALSDVSRTIATPMETLARTKLTQDIKRLNTIIASQHVGGLVLGYPMNMDGSLGPRAQATQDYALELGRRIELPILLWDERMSTLAVTRTMLEADLSRARRSELVDKMAAAYILQGVLDRMNYRP